MRLSFVTWLICLTPLYAQSPVTADEALVLRGQLHQARTTFDSDLANATRPIKQGHVNTLADFEQQSAEDGNYDQAIFYRDQRLSLLDEISQHDPAIRRAREATAIPLLLRNASLTGSVALRRDLLDGWKTNSTSATWNLRGLKPGLYEVLVTYSCTQESEEKLDSSETLVQLRAGGQFSFGEDSRLLKGEHAPLVHEVLPTADWDTFREVSIGKLTLSNAAVSLRLRVLETKPLGLMRLQKIALYPIENSLEDAEQPNAEELRRSFQAATHRRRNQILSLYKTECERRLILSKAAGDAQLTEEITQYLKTLATPEPQP